MEQKQRFSLRKNKVKLGLGVLTVLATPIAVNTVASSDVLAAQGWVKSGNTWYFYNQNGTLAKNAWAGNYWLGADGKMVTNAWVDNGRYYVGKDGAWVKGAQKPAAAKPAVTQKQGWAQTNGAWYFYHQGQVVRNAWVGSYWLGADGKMATSSWVDNGRYYVGANGVWAKDAKKPEEPKPVEKKQGWVKEGNTWYYFENGSIARNKWIGSTYWVGADGKMATSSWVDNGRYYVGANGAWIKDAKKPETPKPVEKKQGWVKEGTVWYYYHQGQIVKNAWVGSYWLGSDGKMATSTWVDNGRYYVGANGAWIKDAKRPEEKKTGWVKEANVWYYYNTDGTLARNKWAGNYWLAADGKMATNAWVDNGRYYVGANGAWVKDAKRPEEKKTGWIKEANVWYYYNTDGTLARNKWAGNYWLGADGKMATNAWVDNGRYYVGANGAWVPNYSKSDKNVSALDMPQYYQWDARWGARRYGIGTMAQSGCVPAALAMVFNGLGQKVLPTAVADTIYNNTNEMNVRMIGTSGKGAVYAINAYGYKHSVITSKAQLIAALQSGKPVFGNMGRGIFASGTITHAIILSGYNNGKTKAMDPYTTYNTGKWYDVNTIWNQRSTDPYDNNIGGTFVAIG